MTKTVNLPERVYEDLVNVSEELTLVAKKPVSLSMAVSLLMEVYNAHMNNPCARDAFNQQLRNSDILSPAEFDKMWDETPTDKPNKKRKLKKIK